MIFPDLLNKKLSCFAILLSFIFISSCEQDVDLRNWKDTPAIYGLLNIKDSVQYIRINRAFSSDDPYSVVSIPDSVTYGFDELEVTLRKIESGSPSENIITLEPTNKIPKDDGLFTTKNFNLYKTVII